jgi:hypothetical protein
MRNKSSSVSLDYSLSIKKSWIWFLNLVEFANLFALSKTIGGSSVWSVSLNNFLHPQQTKLLRQLASITLRVFVQHVSSEHWAVLLLQFDCEAAVASWSSSRDRELGCLLFNPEVQNLPGANCACGGMRVCLWNGELASGSEESMHSVREIPL